MGIAVVLAIHRTVASKPRAQLTWDIGRADGVVQGKPPGLTDVMRMAEFQCFHWIAATRDRTHFAGGQLPLLGCPFATAVTAIDLLPTAAIRTPLNRISINRTQRCCEHDESFDSLEVAAAVSTTTPNYSRVRFIRQVVLCLKHSKGVSVHGRGPNSPEGCPPNFARGPAG